MTDTLRDLLRFTDEQKQELRRRMMTDTLRDRISQIQAEHIDGQLTNYDAGREECGCGHQGNATYREHLADAILAIPGVAVVELPEQMVDREEVPEAIRHQSMWEREYAWATIQDDGLIYFENGSGGSGYGTVNAAEARDLAAALLAAADFAERDQ